MTSMDESAEIYLDRTLCAEPCGVMHYFDADGNRVDECAHESAYEREMKASLPDAVADELVRRLEDGSLPHRTIPPLSGV